MTLRNQITLSILNFLDEIGNHQTPPPTMVQQTVVINFNIGGVNLQDPHNFNSFLTKTRYGVGSEFAEGIAFGKAVLAYCQQKFDERTFEMGFTTLKYAVKDLEGRQTLNFLNAVIAEVKKHQVLILKFLQKEVKESLLEKMYNDAKAENSRTFIDVFDIFIKKYLEINGTSDQKLYEKWLYDRNEFFNDIVGTTDDDFFFKSVLHTLREKWLNHRDLKF